MSRQEGTVKWFSTSKGYGFIAPDNNGNKDIFVHITALEQAGLNGLNEGQKISFETEEKVNKVSAINLRLIKT